VLLLAIVAAGGTAQGKTKLDVEVGWGDKFRPGRWTPLYITAADTTQRQAVIEIYAPTDRRYAMRVQQGLAVGPNPITVPLFVPLSYQLQETTVSVHDAGSFRRLANLILGDTPAYQGQTSGPVPIGTNQLLIGISGKSSSERLVAAQFEQQNIVTGYLNPARPGPEPVPPVSPIVNVLPRSLGGNETRKIDPAALADAGLPARFQKLAGRAVSDPRPGSVEVPLFPGHAAYRRWVGFGQVMLVPIDVSTLTFNSSESAVEFWRKALKNVIPLPAAEDPNSQPGYGFGMGDPHRAGALRQTMDWIGDIPGAGRFGFSYLAAVLLTMIFVVGPLDWFVLKRLGRQPWTWVTITGWIALVTLGAIYIGHIFKSGETYFRTVSVIDESDGSRVAAIDVAGIYSPRTQRYELTLEPESWWRPASEANPYGSSGLQLELDFHQDYRGNRPIPMVINVWNMRFLEGADITPAPPLIEASLRRAGSGRVTGQIFNRGEMALTALRIRTREGMGTLSGLSIAPGSSGTVDVRLRDDRSLVATQPTAQDPWLHRYQQQPTTQPNAVTLNGLSDQRTKRIDQMLADREDVACVYAEFERTTAPARIRLNVQNPNESHRGVVRAIVPLE
jgi:hypothetical protein